MKLKPDELEKYIFSRLGKIDENVILGPKYGEDAAIIKLDNIFLVVHSDPITAAVDKIGFLSVYVACNDIVTRGATPKWLSNVLLLPEKIEEKQIDQITRQIDLASKDVGVMIVSGHSEYVSYLNSPIIITTAIGIADRIIKTSDAKPNDYLVLIKEPALEGTSIIATDFRETLLKKGVKKETIIRAEKFIYEISIVKEALLIKDLVSAMHDATEGGILGAIAEVVYSSGTKFVLDEAVIKFRKETIEICNAVGINPFKLISSGCFIVSVPEKNLDELEERLRKKNINYTILGKLEEGEGFYFKRKNGSMERIDRYVEEEIYKLF